MGKSTLTGMFYALIAEIGWKLFLFGSRLTEEAYFKQIEDDVKNNSEKK